MQEPVDYIGCCGAYCKTCKPFIEGFCKGCKLGYGEGRRDINKAKCKIKVCCFKEHALTSCADCGQYDKCELIKSFHGGNGAKYKKYKQSVEFIRQHGYGRFLELSAGWKNAYGRLEPKN